jgi:hypothetical protein
MPKLDEIALMKRAFVNHNSEKGGLRMQNG